MFEKIRFAFILIVVGFILGAGTGWLFFNGKLVEYQDRITVIENANTILTDENTRALASIERLSRNLNNVTRDLANVTGRIAIAQGIVAEIGNDLGGAADTVDRIIRRIELLESALSVIFASWEN